MGLLSYFGHVIRLALFYGFVRHLPDSTAHGELSLGARSALGFPGR